MLARTLLLVALAAPLTAPLAAQAADGEALLRRINAAHRETWFTTMTFVQQSSWPGSGRPNETWYETMERPGKLRIDIERNDSMVGTVIFRNDTIHQLSNGQLRGSRPLVHSLLVLLHDVHVGDIDAAIGKLRGSGFDLSRTHATRWQDRPVTVVGAAAGDTASAQFWVDSERLVVLRVIQPTPNGGINDTHVGGYTQQGNALVEGEITFHTNGVPGMREIYTQIRTGMPVDPMVFDPSRGELPAWVAEWKRQH